MLLFSWENFRFTLDRLHPIISSYSISVIGIDSVYRLKYWFDVSYKKTKWAKKRMNDGEACTAINQSFSIIICVLRSVLSIFMLRDCIAIESHLVLKEWKKNWLNAHLEMLEIWDETLPFYESKSGFFLGANASSSNLVVVQNYEIVTRIFVVCLLVLKNK